MKAIYYEAPHGEQEVINIKKINEEDEIFFVKHGIVISMEQVAVGDFVVYADTGIENEDGESEEFLEIAQGRSCEDVLHSLRNACEGFILAQAIYVRV